MFIVWWFFFSTCTCCYYWLLAEMNLKFGLLLKSPFAGVCGYIYQTLILAARLRHRDNSLNCQFFVTTQMGNMNRMDVVVKEWRCRYFTGWIAILDWLAPELSPFVSRTFFASRINFPRASRLYTRVSY